MIGVGALDSACDAPADSQQALPAGRHQAGRLAQRAVLDPKPYLAVDQDTLRRAFDIAL